MFKANNYKSTICYKIDRYIMLCAHSMTSVNMSVWRYVHVVNTRCLRKKYGVADYQYFKNGNTQQCNIFRHNKYNFYLIACEISSPYYVMPSITKVMNLRRMVVKQQDLDYQMTNLHTRVFYHQSPFWPIVPRAVITLVTFDIWDWNFTHT